MDSAYKGLVESDANGRYPWECQESNQGHVAQTEGQNSSSVEVPSGTPMVRRDRSGSGQKSPASLTQEETVRIAKSLGKIKNWLAKSTCKTTCVPGDLRQYIRTLFDRNPDWMLKLEDAMLARLNDLNVISSQQLEIYRREGAETTPDDDFLEYLFRRGMRAVLNFTMVLYEEQKIDAVIKIVDHIFKRGYIPNETTSPESVAQKMAYLSESRLGTAHVEVEKGQYQGISEIYKMSAQPRGFVLVINNEEFSMSGGAYNDRPGTHVDGENLCWLFSQLGFEIFEGRQHWNKTKTEMVKIVQHFAQSKVHHAADAVVICVLSHGTTRGRISGIDGEHITDSELQECFSPNECPALARKPKIFLFVACRGSERDLGMNMSYSSPANLEQMGTKAQFLAPSLSLSDTSKVASDALPRTTIDGFVKGDNRDETARHRNQDPPVKISSHSDFIVVHSTVPDHQSLRHIKEGTFFVQEFVKVLSKEARSYDFLTMLTEVNNRLTEITYAEEKQTMVFASTLRKRLFFNPGF